MVGLLGSLVVVVVIAVIIVNLSHSIGIPSIMIGMAIVLALQSMNRRL